MQKQCGEEKTEQEREQGGGRGDSPLRQHCESAHLAGAVQLRLQTLRRRQGMKRGGKTSAERRIVAGHPGCRSAREREGEAGEGKEREKQGLDAEISVTYSPCAKISTPLDRWKPNWDKVCDDKRYHMRDATGESIGPYFDLTLNTYIAF